ncbi:hypothetical protein Cantr_03936 [Candida viswanathii]|uniref:Uncharacterized protein n=1 Tax=Candida viswanathii TaxID=5486 RepID=A0A367XNY8_9ASCO|nr:hypothetical protein Cantr_03936 [Candida viswanathii]
MEDSQNIQSLKLIIDEKKIRTSKLKEFHLVFPEIDTFVEVSDTPNPASYTQLPTLVANDGTTYKFMRSNETTPMLSSSSSSEESDQSVLSESDYNKSTLQTTQQEYILSSSQSILRSDDFF